MSVASPVDIKVNPSNTDQRYILWGNGEIVAQGGAVPINDHPEWFHRTDQPVAVALHILNWTTGAGYLLDMQGGFHALNGASLLTIGTEGAVSGVPYTSGHTRKYVDMSMDPAGTGQGYVLDQWGQIYPFGGATPPPRTGRRYTTPRAVALKMQWSPSKLGVQLDWNGRVFPEFGVTAVPSQGEIVPTRSAFRDLVVTDWTDAANPKGYKLTLHGSVRAFGGATVPYGWPYNPGGDVARALAVISGGDPLILWQVWAGGQPYEWVSSSPPTVIAGAGENEVQTVTITGSPTGGTFTLTYAGQTTGAIARNATASTVKTALEALSNIGVGDVTVTGGPGPGTPWVVTFTGALSSTDVAQMTATSSLTGGSSPAVSVVTTAAGIAPSPAKTVTTTTRPDLTWDYSDPQGDSQSAWQVLVYTQAWASGHSMTDPLAWVADAVVAREGIDRTARGIYCPVDLANGDYRLYVRAQDSAGQWSAWADYGWTQNVPAPATPTALTATPDQDALTVALQVSATTGGSANLIRFVASDDDWVTWQPVAGADAVPLASATYATDVAAPLGLSRKYRAYAYAVDPAVVSAASNTASATLTDRVHALTALDDPTISGRVSVRDDLEWVRPVPSAVFQGIGAKYPTVLTDGGPRAARATLRLWSMTADSWALIEALAEANSVLVYRDPFGNVRYCRLVGDWPQRQVRAAPTTEEVTPLRHMHTTELPLVEVAPPHLGD